jgi:pimeloyl-ACP methyl ester carboxylesterase
MSVSTYGKIAEVAYLAEPPLAIGDYHLLPYRSTNRIKVYCSNARQLVLGIRGTELSDVNDLIASLHVFNNNLSSSHMFSEVKAHLEMFLAEKSYRDIIIVGHSLGGSLAIELLNTFPDQIKAVYVFNPGYGYKKLIAEVIQRLSCLNNHSLRECIDLQTVQRKLHVYITGFDPISTLARFNRNVHNINPITSNFHSIYNLI